MVLWVVFSSVLRSCVGWFDRGAVISNYFTVISNEFTVISSYFTVISNECERSQDSAGRSLVASLCRDDIKGLCRDDMKGLCRDDIKRLARIT